MDLKNLTGTTIAVANSGGGKVELVPPGQSSPLPAANPNCSWTVAVAEGAKPLGSVGLNSFTKEKRIERSARAPPAIVIGASPTGFVAYRAPSPTD